MRGVITIHGQMVKIPLQNPGELNIFPVSLEKISVFQTLLKLCVNCGIPTDSTMAPQCGNSFSTVVPHKQIMEETEKCGITVEYRRIYLNCGKTVEKLLAYSVTWI